MGNRELARAVRFAVMAIVVTCASSAPAARPGPPKSWKLGKLMVFSTPSKYGYIDRTGRFKLVLNQYARLCSFSEGLAAVRLPNKKEGSWDPQSWGFIDKTGKRVIEAKFQMAHDFKDGLAAVNVGGSPHGGVDFCPGWPSDDWRRPFVYPVVGDKWGYIDKTGKPVADIGTCYRDAYREGLIVVKSGDKYGCIDKTGKKVIAGRFHALHPFHEGLAACQPDKGGKWGFVNRRGKMVIKPQFDDPGYHCSYFQEGLAPFRKGGKWGYVNTKGQIAIAARFDIACDFSGGLAHVEIGDKWVYVDRTGKIVADRPQAVRHDITIQGRRLELVREFTEGLAAARIEGHWGYINAASQWVITPRFAGAGAFRDGVARVNTTGWTPADTLVRGGRWRYIDTTGTFISPLQFEASLDFHDGLAVAYLGRRYGLKDASGLVIHEAKFGSIALGFAEGMARFSLHGRYGFLDESGQIVIKPHFEDANQFAEGLARVQLRYLDGFIDKTGTLVIPARFAQAEDFAEARARVRIGDQYGFIDKSGKIVIAPKFDQAESFSHGLSAVGIRRNSDAYDCNYGYIDRKGNIVIKPHLEYASSFAHGLADVVADGKWGAIDKTGKWIVPPIFEDPLSPADALPSFVFQGKRYAVDSQGTVKNNAGKAVGTVADILIPALAKKINSDDIMVRKSTIRSIGMFATPRAIALLKPLLRGSNWYDCTVAAHGLEIGRPGAGIQFLAQALADKKPAVRRTAASALGHLTEYPSCARTLLTKLSLLPPEVRRPLAARARAALAVEDEMGFGQKLSETLPKLDFPGVPLELVIQFMREVGGLEIEVDWKELAKLGIAKSHRITLHTQGQSFIANLRLVLMNAGPIGTLDYECHGRKIVILAAGLPKTGRAPAKQEQAPGK